MFNGAVFAIKLYQLLRDTTICCLQTYVPQYIVSLRDPALHSLCIRTNV